MKQKTKIGIAIIILLILSLSFNIVQANGKKINKEVNYELARTRTYTVIRGDSLYKLSIKFDTTISRIKDINNLQTNMIYIGQELKIPVEETTDTYTVRPGDSLYKLAIKFDTTIQKIKNLNNLNSNIIYINQKLKIPDDNKADTDSKDTIKKYTSISGKIKINNKSKKSSSSQDQTVKKQVKTYLAGQNPVKRVAEKEIIIKYKPMIEGQAVDKHEKENKLETLNVSQNSKGKVIHYKVPEDRNLEDVIEYYSKLDHVEWAEPNYIYYPTAIPSDPWYNNYQWDYVNMNLEAAWDQQTGNKTVKIGLIDTGVLPNHSDLKDNLISGADFVGGEKSYPISQYNITDRDPTDETTMQQGGSHGTHVAGIIGAVTNNHQGIAGVNWQTKILPIRVLKKTGGTSWDVVEGIYYAIDQGVDIINMSLGSPHNSYYQAEAIKKAVEQGITVVAASGNEGNTSVYYPAAYPETIAVGSVGQNNTRAGYSNYGPEVDVVAPGGDYGETIYSTWGYYNPDTGGTITRYGGMIGTSMATPHVSGLAGLLVANGVDDPEEIKSRIIDTAIDLGSPGKDDYYGHGIVDAYGALLGKQMDNPSVFAGVRQDGNYKVMSEIKEINDDGSFHLDEIENKDVYIIGWRDVNKNGQIDQGDYYGKTDITINQMGNNISFAINYISSFSSIKVIRN